jgi:ATP-dependent exoDNAse (exonuclease V) beta subunit
VIRASAGSGKTHRLTNRYLSLLAADVEPETILATSFTRKAAGEILNRILDRLATAAADGKKATQLASQLGGEDLTKQTFVRLLRRMVSCLHRLRIGTLDSFYIALAGSFQFELGLPPGWSICEQDDDARLRDEALEQLLLEDPDQIINLLPLLSKGEIKRSVHGELQGVIDDHYESYRGSTRPAWEALHVPEPVALEQVLAAIQALRDFDFAACRDKRFAEARDNDIQNFESEDWSKFISKGLAGNILAGKSTYRSKDIPAEARFLYETLIHQAQSRALQRLADQTQATWSLLDGFHRKLWALKQSGGALRFQEVTQAIVESLGRHEVPMDSLAFRLDGDIWHLLLDEFQDTSLAQWRVLEPIARRITRAGNSSQSFFCVGDVKQAIYGWRGGMAEIFRTVQTSLGKLEELTLAESRRSAQPIIDVVNTVFGKLGQLQLDDKVATGLANWSERFERHSTVKKEASGYVVVDAGPAQNGRRVGEQRIDHCRYVAEKVHDLINEVAQGSIGILCRKNDTVARMIFELRRLGVDASEEGGNPLTDSAAVELVLSLFSLADHPGHSVAWFHLKNSPLKDHFAYAKDSVRLSRQVRRDLAALGYGAFTHRWAKLLAPACDRRDLSRLQQLVEIAYDLQPRSTLRAADFVRWIRERRIPDPTNARVRVMTIHSAKGLEFDIVVLPELDSTLQGQTPTLITGRDLDSMDANFVCRYANEELRSLLKDDERLAFEREQQQRVEESLSLLYVAMTRAVHSLLMFIPGPRDGRSTRKDAWYKLLLKSIEKEADWKENTRIFEHGDPKWHEKTERAAMPATNSAPTRHDRIFFRAENVERRRGLEHVAPSRQEGQGKIALSRLFDRSERPGMATGTVHHAWFALVDWLDDGVPTQKQLLAAAELLRADLPDGIWKDIDRLADQFRAYLAKPEIGAVLRRSAYSDPECPAFPGKLKPCWTKSLSVQQVERERRFLVRDGSRFWNGTLDRVVWLVDRGRKVAADAIDFKTDAIRPGDLEAVRMRTDFYRPQLEVYCQAIARFAKLPIQQVSARLVFTEADCVVEV